MPTTSVKDASGPGLSSAPGTRRGAVFPPYSTRSSGPPIFEKSSSQDVRYPEELRGLLDEAGVVRRRILVNRSLVYWLASWNIILGLLILAAASSSHLEAAIVTAAILLAICGVVSLLLATRRGPSLYAAACQLDAAAGLEDRLSTTVYFAAADDPDWMILHQRRDALARLKRVDARTLFPLQIPATIRRTAVLALITVGFLAYRIKYGPPVYTLVHKASQAHVVEALISPLSRVIQNSPLNVVKPPKTDTLDAEAEAAGVTSKNEKEPNFGPPVGQPGANDSGALSHQNSPALYPTDSKSAQRGPQSPSQSPSNGNLPTDSSQQGQQKNGSDQNSSKGATDAKSASAGQSPANGQASRGGQQSLGQKLMEALKDMMGNTTAQDSSQLPSQSAQQTQGPSAQGQGGQPSESAGKGSQQSALNDAKAKDTQANSGSHSGAGNGTQQPTAKPADQNASAQNNLIPERVPLDASDFRVQTHPRAMEGPGSAEVPLTNASVNGNATTNGAEQQNIPMRYREYVQHYFDQAQK
jgi:hypothetical protein